MEGSLGILAFGSLIDNPGAEIEAALVGRKLNIRTPFGVEFARSSNKRGGRQHWCLLSKAALRYFRKFFSSMFPGSQDRLWRGEIDRVGQGGHYTRHANPGPNTLIIDCYENSKPSA